jgi:large subunit ribosomal protein L4
MNTIPVYNAQGTQEGTLSLSSAVQQKESNPTAHAQAIRVLRQNWRQGTAACKTRGEVAFSTRKPWKQKGTGRARVSSLKSPLWRKGGIIFGPQPRVRMLALPQEQRKLVLNNLLFGALERNAIHCVDFALTQDAPNTKAASHMLKGLNLHAKKAIVFMAANDGLLYASFRNIPSVQIVFFDDTNAYDLSNANCWLFMKKDTELFNAMVTRWN